MKQVPVRTSHNVSGSETRPVELNVDLQDASPVVEVYLLDARYTAMRSGTREPAGTPLTPET